MSQTLFDERERAAEYGFTHAEELRFLARREGIEVLARWAAEALGEDPEAGASYSAALVGRLVGGAGDADLVAQVRRDLEGRGRQDLSDEVAQKFARALAEASDRLHGRLPLRREPVHPPARFDVSAAPHPHGFWGWTV